MRTHSVLTITSISNAVAGALFVFAFFWQGSLGITLSLMGVSVVLALASIAWSILKFRKSFKRIEQQSATLEAGRTGLTELDHIGLRFLRLVDDTKHNSANAATELAEVKRLLDKIDRRERDYDRDGMPIDCATRLRSILKGCGGELDSSIQQTISCSREIHRATEEIVSGAESQSDTVDQTTSYIERLSEQILTVCDNAESALTSSSNAQTTAQNGLARFEELVDAMKQIRNHASAREKKLQALGQHTKEIEAIVQTIGTLSSRTDLLALNASIESVRAGEHGRGFAVVAEEVRALAEQSAQAVLDISRRIEMIQLETHQSISVASGEHDQMHDVIKRVTETTESLQDICDAAANSANGLTEISDCTSQQLQLTREIIGALERSTETSKKNRSRAEGANWTAKTLSQIGTQLESSLEIFRLSDSNGRNSQPAPENLDSNRQDTQTPAMA